MWLCVPHRLAATFVDLGLYPGPIGPDSGRLMAAPNYSFEKRKREMAKKAAKEAKRQRKAEKAAASASATPEAPAAEPVIPDAPQA